MFLVSLLFLFGKRSFLKSEWNIVSKSEHGINRYTAEVHPYENKLFYLSIWKDDTSEQTIIQTPDEAVLATAQFGFLSQNSIKCNLNHSSQKLEFEAKFQKNSHKQEYLEIQLDQLTSLNVTFVNNSFIQGEIYQFGKGKAVTFFGVSHDRFKTPFSLTTKQITYGAIGVFIFLQVRGMIKNIKEIKKEDPEREAYQKEFNDALRNLVIKEDEPEEKEEKENEKEKATEKPKENNNQQKKKTQNKGKSKKQKK